MIRSRLTLFALAFFWASSGCRSAGPRDPRPVNIAPLEDGEALAFSHAALPGGLPDISLLDGEHGLRTIARSDRYNTGPLWSPDGSRLLYQQSYGWEADFFLLASETWEARQLTRDGFYKYQPRWSLDGSTLAYLSVNAPGDPSHKPESLHILDVLGGESRVVLFERILDYRWRPDGQSVFVVSRAGDLTTAEEVSLDGSRKTLDFQLDFLNRATAFSLSPDATRVAYALPEPDPEALVDPLYIAAIDGTGGKKIGGFATDSSLAWSPDSARLAFVSFGEQDRFHYALFTVNADGSGLKELLALDTADESGEILPGTPAWSADSRKVAIPSFSSPAGAAIFLLDAGGFEIRQVTKPDGLIDDLSWRP